MRALLNGLYRLSEFLAAVGLVGIALLILAQILGRAVGFLVASADEFSGYCLAASLFLGLAPTFRKSEHIRVGLLIDRLTERNRLRLEIMCLAISAALVGYFSWFTVEMVITSYEINEISQGLIPFPVWTVQSAMAAGLVVLLIALVDDLIVVLSGRRPSYLVARDQASTDDLIAFEK